MYNNLIKVGLIAIVAIGLNACSSKNYKIKQETDKIVNEVPKWYIEDLEKKNAMIKEARDIMIQKLSSRPQMHEIISEFEY